MDNHIWKFSERECEVHFPKKLFKKISKLAKIDLPNETGGTLVGYYTGNKSLAIIVDVLVVSSSWPKFLQRFIRPPDSTDKQLSKIFRETKGAIHYLGDWHSHPNTSPKPSSTDIDTLIDDAIDQRIAIDTPILFIIGKNLNEAFTDCTCTMTDKKKVYTGKYSKDFV